MNKHSQLSKILGYEFNDPSLLKLALTHRSAASVHNERLEFLGDSVLSIIISEELYSRFPKLAEGELSRMRSALVKGETLAVIGKEFKLGDVIGLGAGELKSGGFRRDSILADAVEAIIGGIYLDSDFATIKKLLLKWYAKRLDEIQPGESHKDNKTRLQEFLQSRQMPLPLYQVEHISGQAHNQQFKVSCTIEGSEKSFMASGSSRRKAEQAAAAQALEHLGID